MNLNRIVRLMLWVALAGLVAWYAAVWYKTGHLPDTGLTRMLHRAAIVKGQQQASNGTATSQLATPKRAEPAPPPAPDLPLQFAFSGGADALDADQLATLDALARILAQSPAIHLEIRSVAGVTGGGTSQGARALALRRARQVVARLDAGGVLPVRLSVSGRAARPEDDPADRIDILAAEDK